MKSRFKETTSTDRITLDQAVNILVVEDDNLFRNMMVDKLVTEGFQVSEAGEGKTAMKVVKDSIPDLIITDLIMPEMDGFEFIRWVRENYFDIPVIVVTGREDFEAIHSITSFWVYDYLVKPVNMNDLTWSIKGAIQKIQVNNREKMYIRSLEKQVEVQMEKNRFLFYEAVQSLVNALEAKDRYTQGHSLRVTRLAHSLTKELSLSDMETSQVSLAGQLHDIGKLAISDQILHKTSKLTDEEYSIIKLHPVVSHKILGPILRGTSLDAVLHHHERWDGKGYPDGLVEDKIPISARIIAVADAFDAMTSERAYRQNLSNQEASEEIERCSGTQFDPDLVPLFASMVREI